MQDIFVHFFFFSTKEEKTRRGGTFYRVSLMFLGQKSQQFLSACTHGFFFQKEVFFLLLATIFKKDLTKFLLAWYTVTRVKNAGVAQWQSS